MTNTSSWLWWLNTNTAGRCSHTCCSPVISTRTPASAREYSADSAIIEATAVRRLPLSSPNAAPVPMPVRIPHGRRRPRDGRDAGQPARAEVQHRPALGGGVLAEPVLRRGGGGEPDLAE